MSRDDELGLAAELWRLHDLEEVAEIVLVVEVGERAAALDPLPASFLGDRIAAHSRVEASVGRCA